MQLVFSNEIAEVWKNEVTGQSALYARKDFQAGDKFNEVGASAILKSPSYLTVQKDTDEHICLHPQFLQYINHSCSPNVFFDISNGYVVCLQDIKVGTELTYFYPSTEWKMASPFQCNCGNDNCLQVIRGAAFLPLETLRKYRLSEFILRQLRTNEVVL